MESDKHHLRLDSRRDLRKGVPKEEVLALEALRLVRSALLIHLRFLDAALIRFVPLPSPDAAINLATDGRVMFFNPWHILRSFKNSRAGLARDYLHLTVHCLMRHLFVGKKIIPELWDLSCDIAAENLINSLNLKFLEVPRVDSQLEIIADLEKTLGRLTAEKLYRHFKNIEDLEPERIAALRSAFVRDDHSVWYEAIRDGGSGGAAGRDKTDSDAEGTGGDDDRSGPDKDDDAGETADDDRDDDDGELTGAAGLPDDDSDDGKDDKNDDDQDGDSDGGEKTKPGPDDDLDDDAPGTSGGEGDGSGREHEAGRAAGRDEDPEGPEETGDDKQPNPREELEKEWRELARRIEVDLETVAGRWGRGEGELFQQLKSLNEERYDYQEFLRRFAVMGENVEVNSDEFDYIFYSYGLRLYKNMPLVEPLEYRETERVREFVVALDTSQSVSGDLVQRFVQKTYNILKQSKNFFTQINVHIIQCGSKVYEDAKVTSQEEFDRYLETMTLRGFGGTDFRPVFEHVDFLISCREFLNLKGLVYFTDGYGDFPAMPPAYEAAFVFVTDPVSDKPTPDVPPWAIKVVLTEEQIENF
ncbi:MAG: VWA-like domain-containing protein [Deltaproteobacteria bacterium]|nr:VWA-like domain-containing protein [Deltaproteobacteria bacterium]